MTAPIDPPPDADAGVRPARIAVWAASEAVHVRERAAGLAAQLALPVAERDSASYDLLLTVTEDRLELRGTRRGDPGPVCVDFIRGPLGYRRRAGHGESLFRAVGLRRGVQSVVDATAGLCRDAVLLACRGCEVMAIERSGVVLSLAADAVQRARAEGDDALRGALRERLRLVNADARDSLRQLRREDAPDVVYLDPMYPHRTKTALVGKEMRVLRRVVGDDTDAGELLSIARAVAGRFVVVKRMRLAPPLAPDVTRTYAGRTTRYDIYEP